MPTRVMKAAFCIGLMAMGAAAVERSDLVQVKITVLDANGRSIDNLQQGDFVFSHATYILAFRAARGIPPSRHSIEVLVKRPDARPRYSTSQDY